MLEVYNVKGQTVGGKVPEILKYDTVVVVIGKALTKQDMIKYPKKNQEYLSMDVSPERDGVLYREFTTGGKEIAIQGPLDVTLIPFYAWADRGPAYMSVWIPMARNGNCNYFG